MNTCFRIKNESQLTVNLSLLGRETKIQGTMEQWVLVEIHIWGNGNTGGNN